MAKRVYVDFSKLGPQPVTPERILEYGAKVAKDARAQGLTEFEVRSKIMDSCIAKYRPELESFGYFKRGRVLKKLMKL